MFNLDIQTIKLEEFKKLLNKANITNRVFGKNEDDSVTTLKFKSQEELDKAQEILNKIN